MRPNNIGRLIIFGSLTPAHLAGLSFAPPALAGFAIIGLNYVRAASRAMLIKRPLQIKTPRPSGTHTALTPHRVCLRPLLPQLLRRCAATAPASYKPDGRGTAPLRSYIV